MKQINWQNSIEDGNIEHETWRGNSEGDNGRRLQKKSYVKHFMDTGSGDKKHAGYDEKSRDDRPTSYKDRYLRGNATAKKDSVRHESASEAAGGDNKHPGKSSDAELKKSDAIHQTSSRNFDTISGKEHPQELSFVEEDPPIFEFKKEDENSRKSWSYLNLKNKKQAGDLFKKILYFNKKNDAKVFNFVGSRGGEGVTSIFANLIDYVDLQTSIKKILVIDANRKSPQLHKVFNVPATIPGLMDIFSSNVAIRKAVIPVSSNIYLMHCGTETAQKYGNLTQDNFGKLIDYCRIYFDYIFIDSPPVLSSADSLSVAPAADYTFLVIQSSKDERPVINKVKTLLQNDECSIGGVILNRVQQVIPGWLYRFI